MTTKPGDLTYGTQYAFTVTAVNDRGASSKASAPSNTVVPFTVAERAEATAGADRGRQGQHRGRLAAGRCRTVVRSAKYVVTVNGSSQDVTGTNAVTLTGLPDGTTVTVTVTAVNAAGAGPPASASAKTISASAAHRRIGRGARVQRDRRGVHDQRQRQRDQLRDLGQRRRRGRHRLYRRRPSAACGPATTYSFTVTATNKAGSATFAGSATTATVTGTVVCNNTSYCGHGSTTGGIWVYTTPTQTGTAVGAAVRAEPGAAGSAGRRTAGAPRSTPRPTAATVTTAGYGYPSERQQLHPVRLGQPRWRRRHRQPPALLMSEEHNP